MKNQDIPTFPVIASNQTPVDNPGMTLRDWFAGLAMQGICSQQMWENCEPEVISKWAYEQADAMLARRAK